MTLESAILVAIVVSLRRVVVVVHVAGASLGVSAVGVHVLLQLGQLSRTVNFEVHIAHLLRIKDVLKPLGMSCLHVEHSACVVFETAHTFDVLGDLFWAVASQNVPDEGNSVERFLHGDLERDTVFLAIEQRSLGHLLLMVAREQSQTLAKRFLNVAAILFDQVLRSFSEPREHLLVDFLQLLHSAHAGGFDYLFGLRNTNLLHCNASLLLDVLQHELVLVREKSDASATAAGTGGTARSVNVSFGVFWRLNLDYEVN